MIALACSAALHAQTANAPVSKFLRLEDAQRFWYLEGAFAAVAHLVGMHDKQQGECAGNWYLKDREAKRRLVEKTMAEHPAAGPTTIVISLLTKTCGPLALK